MSRRYWYEEEIDSLVYRIPTYKLPGVFIRAVYYIDGSRKWKMYLNYQKIIVKI